MKLIFVHGWGVTSTDTYGELPKVIAKRAAAVGLSLDIESISLTRYISFHDEVRMDDVVRALQCALLETLPDGEGGIEPFSCITHSTGGPVMRCWVDRYYGASNLAACPLKHLIMLAPANHGSPLAALGTQRLGRIKAWFQGIEPGAGILRWLEIGSLESRALNEAWLSYRPRSQALDFRPFIIIGQTIDPHLYDYVNSYTGERGSDGVVRAAGANLDYSWLHLRESDETIELTRLKDTAGCPVSGKRLIYQNDLRVSEPCPYQIIPKASHTGDEIGIMASPTLENLAEKPVVTAILQALKTTTKADYEGLMRTWAEATEATQEADKKNDRYFQLIVNVRDDQGQSISDFDFVLLAGPSYDPDKLRKGFFVDKQFNKHSSQTVTFFFNYDVLMSDKTGNFGFRILARPDTGFAYYSPVEFRSDALTLDAFVDPNTTLYVDIILRRHVDKETTRFESPKTKVIDFEDVKPGGMETP